MQLCDNLSRLILIKTPRRIAAKMRAVFAWITSLPATNQKTPLLAVVLTVMGEHGSLRTAKRSMITKLRGAYRGLLVVKDKKKGESRPTNDDDDNNKAHKIKIGQSLQTILQELHAIDF